MTQGDGAAKDEAAGEGAARRRLLVRGAGLALAGGVPPAALRFALGGAAAGAVAVSPGARAETPAGEIRLRDLYEKDLSFSALATSLDGEPVAVSGFMAPPLKANAGFFVLTKRPMATCPFCNDAADWPNDIALVRTKRELRVVAFNIGIVVRGRLSLGDERDPETGFFSRLRLVDAVVERA